MTYGKVYKEICIVKIMTNQYRRGRIAEKKVVNDLRVRGFENIRRSVGSRGPADIYAIKDGIKYYVQVKSGSAQMNRTGVQELRALAKKRSGVAVSIHRAEGKNKWKFHGNWS